jgi:hypothetical protein
MLKLIPVKTRKFPPNFIGGEKMFWTGLIIGLFIGANAGLFVFALFAAKKESVSCNNYDSEFTEGSTCCL